MNLIQSQMSRRVCVHRCLRDGEPAGFSAAATETQHSLHHGRRHRLDAAEHLSRGLMVGETPNIDRIGNEGAIFMDYVAMQSCTSGRNAFFTGMYPLRTGIIPPSCRAAHPTYGRVRRRFQFCLDLGYNTGEFGKNHLGDHTAALPTAHGFQEYWGYLYHLDAMQQVSFPDINKNPTTQSVAPPCKNTPIPGIPEVPGAVDPQTTICLTPPRNVLWCKSADAHGEKPEVQR